MKFVVQLILKCWMKLLVLVGALMLAVLPVVAQQTPMHFNSKKHIDVIELARVPAIRFLTTNDFVPFNFEDAGGNLIGFNIDLTREICTELNIDCTLQALPWAQLNNAIENGQGDAIIAGLATEGEWVERFDFTKAYLKLPGRFVSQISSTPVESDLHKSVAKVGVRQQAAHERFIAEQFPNLEIVPFESELAALDAVKNGEVELAFVDGMRASFWLNQNECCDFIDGPYWTEEYFGTGLSIAVGQEAGDIKRVLNIALTRLAEKGKITELYYKWFAVGFY